jgi:hypothetical protein
MKNALLWLLLVCLQATGFAQDLQLEKAYLETAKKTQNRLLAKARQEEYVLQNELQQLSKRPTNKAVAAQRATYKEKLAALERARKKLNETLVGILDMSEVTTGQVGIIGDGSEPFPVKVLQVTGKNSALVITAGTTFILEADMTNVVDDTFISLLQPVEVMPPRGYTTVTGGSKTVHVLRGLSSEEIKRIVDYAAENKPKRVKELRTWKDVQGKELVKAEFQKREKEKVFVVTEDDKTVELEYAKLSRPDRLFIQNK